MIFLGFASEFLYAQHAGSQQQEELTTHLLLPVVLQVYFLKNVIPFRRNIIAEIKL